VLVSRPVDLPGQPGRLCWVRLGKAVLQLDLTWPFLRLDTGVACGLRGDGIGELSREEQARDETDSEARAGVTQASDSERAVPDEHEFTIRRPVADQTDEQVGRVGKRAMRFAQRAAHRGRAGRDGEGW
jgi:hypothetical protein